MLRAVLFDIDDTLFDHRHSARVSLQMLQAEFPALAGVPIEVLELAHLEILNDVHDQVLAGTITQEAARENRFTMLLARFGAECSAEERSRIREAYRQSYRAARRAMDGVIPLLQELHARGLKIGVISNNLVEEQLDKLETCGLTGFIDSLTISEEAGMTKPDPRIFYLALERLGCAAEEVVMIGDAWQNDIVPARKLGMRTIWFNGYGLQSLDEGVPSLESFSDTNAALTLIIGENGAD